MKNLQEIILQQENFIADLKAKTNDFINQLDKSQIQTILLSGSVSRKDYFPGEFGGMVDLTVIKKAGSSCTAESIFSKNEEPDIPYHCVTKGDVGYQIKFMESLTVSDFEQMQEAQKFAVLESTILYDTDNLYQAELAKIKQKAQEQIKNQLGNDIGYVYHLISEYKTDRWYRRDAFIQLHENLNAAIRVAVRCLFYINNSYAPAEDRAYYYSHSLKSLPANYESTFAELCSQNSNSKEDYLRREKLFRTTILKFIENQLK